MTQEELNKVLEAHKHYLAQDCEGCQYMRAYLRSADLRNADLSDANLRGANLRGANLRSADLWNADLSDADLRNADLWNADLWNADLSDADLRNADLNGADFRNADLSDADLRSADLNGANLWNADLSGANLRGANLRNAYLNGADLRSADLCDANLRNADLNGANLNGAKYNEHTAFFALVCPEEGDFVAWKKVGVVIVKLRVPSEAKRSSATSRKCRCEFAEVLELQNLDGTSYKDDKVINNNYVETIYKVGEFVYADEWDSNRWNECSHGIHFFITRDEAVIYI